MLGIRTSHVAHAFEDFSVFDHCNNGDAFEPLPMDASEDFSVFDCNNGDAFEPFPMDRLRTEQDAAAISSVLQDSIRLLEHSANITRLRQSQLDDSSSPLAATSALMNEGGFPQPTISLNDLDGINEVRVSSPADVPGLQFPPNAVGSLIATNEAVRPIIRLEDQRVSGVPNRPLDEYSAYRFRPYQTELWKQRFNDLLKYRQRHGHCCVPHTYKENPSLARWVKRQRYQYKLRAQGKETTMTNRRVKALEQVGFIWDSHTATWEERLNELKGYHRAHGNCEVPTHYQQNKKLATWVKCQRRQYKLYRQRKLSTMTPERLDKLEHLNFSWEMIPRTETRA